MDDRSFMAWIYRWLIWGTRKARRDQTGVKPTVPMDEKALKILRPAQF